MEVSEILVVELEDDIGCEFVCEFDGESLAVFKHSEEPMFCNVNVPMIEAAKEAAERMLQNLNVNNREKLSLKSVKKAGSLKNFRVVISHRGSTEVMLVSAVDEEDAYFQARFILASRTLFFERRPPQEVLDEMEYMDIGSIEADNGYACR